MLESVELQQVLVIDIETVPLYSSYELVPERLRELWDRKTKYQRKNGETPDEYYSRAGIWAEFGKIVCLSAGVFTQKDGIAGLRIKSFFGHDEKILLGEFNSVLAKQPAGLYLCAHNGKEFDFPYLCRRMLINGLPIPKQLNLAGKRPWEIPHLDTLELWKFGDYKNYTSLDLLAAIFEIETPKDDISGSDVHRVYWQEDDLSRIVSYCQKDVITTAQLLLRFKNLPLVSPQDITIAS